MRFQNKSNNKEKSKPFKFKLREASMIFLLVFCIISFVYLILFSVHIGSDYEQFKLKNLIFLALLIKLWVLSSFYQLFCYKDLKYM